MKNRIDWVDALKGIGILLVVFGHSVITDTKMFNYIYFFHLPLFFFVSGNLFDNNKYSNFKEFLIKKTRSLLIPYISFSLLSILFYLINLQGSPNILKMMVEAKRTVLPYNEALWFLPCLLVIEIIFFLILRYVKKIVLPILIILSFIGFLTINQPKLPITFDSALFYLLFYASGYYFKQFKTKKTGSVLICIAAMIINVATFVLAPKIYHYINDPLIIKWSLTPYIAHLIIAFSGIITTIWISKMLSNSVVLKYFGKYSLIVLGLHLTIKTFLIYPVLVHYHVLIPVVHHSLAIFYTITTCLVLIPCIYLINRFTPFIIGKSFMIQPQILKQTKVH